jgi:hypothetical protein
MRIKRACFLLVRSFVCLFPTHGVMLAESEAQNTLFPLLLLLICFVLSKSIFRRAKIREATDPIPL